MRDWTEELNQYGFKTVPPSAQDSSTDLSTTYSGGSINASFLNGLITKTLQIGVGEDSIFLNSQGIYAGSSVFATAKFSVDPQGNVKANTIILTGYIPTGGALNDVNDTGGLLDAGTTTVVDAGGVHVVDGFGLTSSTQFDGNAITVSTGLGSTNTTDFSYQVPNMALSFSVPRTTNIFVFGYVGIAEASGVLGKVAEDQLAIDGTLVGPRTSSNQLNTGPTVYDLSTNTYPSTIIQVNSGSHTLSMRLATTDAAYAALAASNTATLGYIILGH